MGIWRKWTYSPDLPHSLHGTFLTVRMLLEVGEARAKVRSARTTPGRRSTPTSASVPSRSSAEKCRNSEEIIISKCGFPYKLYAKYTMFVNFN